MAGSPSSAAWADGPMSPVSSTAPPPGPSTRSTSEDSFSSASRPRCVLAPAGDSTRTTRSPTTACWPPVGVCTAAPTSPAAASASASGGGGGPVRGRCQTAATSTVARTAGAPPVWSSSPCVRTRRSIRAGPLLRSQAAARSSRPVSTRTDDVAVVSRNASPCPTSIAVRTNAPLGARTGTAPASQQTTTTAAAIRRPLPWTSSHAEAARTPTRTVGSSQPTTGPHHCRRRAAPRTTPRAGPANRSNTAARAGSGTTTTAAAVQNSDATAAAGTATRLAGRVDSATSPPLVSSTGSTATCAPIVTASRSSSRPERTTRSNGTNRSRTRGATTSTPSVAAADSNSPSRRASSGSSSTRTRTAPASACSGWTRRPRAPATRTIEAIALARRTEGSARVSTAKSASTTTAVRRRPRAPSPTTPAASHAPLTTIATLDPDTAVRWVSPVARIASSSSDGSRLVSPVTRPVASPARDAGSAAAAASASAVRTPVVPAATQPGSSTRSRRARVSLAATWRCCCHGCVATRASAVPA